MRLPAVVPARLFVPVRLRVEFLAEDTLPEREDVVRALLERLRRRPRAAWLEADDVRERVAEGDREELPRERLSALAEVPLPGEPELTPRVLALWRETPRLDEEEARWGRL